MNRALPLLLALASLAACSERTYVLVTVAADPSITAPITALEFSSGVTDGVEVFRTDRQTFSDGGRALALPRSFVILANGWGSGGETVTMLVEAKSSTGEVVGRGRGLANLTAGAESSERVTLTQPCVAASDCLGGAPFCENPHRCDCEGPDCLAGVCQAIAQEDGNPCTEFRCDELGQTTNQDPTREGEDCGEAGDGQAQFCAKGLCKVPACGDFIVDLATGEECDQGSDNSATASGACRTTCKKPSCGDGVLDIGASFGEVYDEECDDGAANVVVPNGASNDATLGSGCRQEVTLEDGAGEALRCVLPRCGDGVLDGEERCDDHDSANGDGCNPTCSLRGEVGLLAGEPGGPGDRDGVGAAARLRPVLGMVAAGGLAYFTSAGTPGPQVIRRLTLGTGELETVAGALRLAGEADGPAAGARFRNPIGLTIVGGALYVADSQNHKIRRLDLATFEVTTVAGTGLAATVDGGPGSGSFSYPTVLAARNSNEMLIMEGSGNCNLRWLNLTTEEVRTLIAPPACISSGTNLGGLIEHMTVAANGRLYLSDDTRILEVSFVNGTNPATDPPTASITTVAGADFSPGLVDATGASARFGKPAGLAASGNTLYVADRSNNALRQVNLGTKVVSTIATAPSLSLPNALAIDGTTLLVAEQATAEILRVTVGGASPLAVASAAGVRAHAGTEDDQNGDAVRDARFSEPRGLALIESAPGLVYVADHDLGAIRVVGALAPSPSVSSIANALTVGGDTINNLVGTLDRLFALAMTQPARTLAVMDASGQPAAGLNSVALNIAEDIEDVAVLGAYAYATVKFSAIILRVTLASGIVEVFSGSPGIASVVDGPRLSARFGAPRAIVACAGALYVAESSTGIFEAHVIRKIDVSVEPVVVSTVAGFATDRGVIDGIGLGARFDNPEALACDDRDPDRPVLYVGEMGGHVVRQIELDSGRVTTLAGAPGIAGALDGVGSAAGFNGPQALVFDPVRGDLFVADRHENIIRRIQ